METTDRLLTIDEVAELTRRPVETLRYWRARGEGPISFRLGRRVVYRESAVTDWSTRRPVRRARPDPEREERRPRPGRRPSPDPFLRQGNERCRQSPIRPHRTPGGPIHESEVFLEAMVNTAMHGLTGGLAPVEALEQVVRLGARVESFLQIAKSAA